jgi:hypothetical protein
MRAEPVLAEPEHAVPDRERRDALTDLGDLAGELAAEDRRLRLRDAAEEANDPGLGGFVMAEADIARSPEEIFDYCSDPSTNPGGTSRR